MTYEPLSPEQMLALAYAPTTTRDALSALWELDARMRRIFGSGRDETIAQIKLAWWQERLADLRPGQALGEPLLTRVSAIAVSDDVRRALSSLVAGWRELPLAEPWTGGEVDAHAASRGRALLALGVGILGAQVDEAYMQAGEAYALSDVAGLAADPATRILVRDMARLRFASGLPRVWPKPLRTIGMLVALARRDVVSGRDERPGSPARMARMAWHGLTGR